MSDYDPAEYDVQWETMVRVVFTVPASDSLDAENIAGHSLRCMPALAVVDATTGQPVPGVELVDRGWEITATDRIASRCSTSRVSHAQTAPLHNHARSAQS